MTNPTQLEETISRDLSASLPRFVADWNRSARRPRLKAVHGLERPWVLEDERGRRLVITSRFDRSFEVLHVSVPTGRGRQDVGHGALDDDGNPTWTFLDFKSGVRCGDAIIRDLTAEEFLDFAVSRLFT